MIMLLHFKALLVIPAEFQFRGMVLEGFLLFDKHVIGSVGKIAIILCDKTDVY